MASDIHEVAAVDFGAVVLVVPEAAEGLAADVAGVGPQLVVGHHVVLQTEDLREVLVAPRVLAQQQLLRAARLFLGLNRQAVKLRVLFTRENCKLLRQSCKHQWLFHEVSTLFVELRIPNLNLPLVEFLCQAILSAFELLMLSVNNWV